MDCNADVSFDLLSLNLIRPHPNSSQLEASIVRVTEGSPRMVWDIWKVLWAINYRVNAVRLRPVKLDRKVREA